MSTGLTYVFIRNENNASPNGDASYIFSSYQEAYEFGDWFTRLNQSEFLFLIWTTSPNQNGYFGYSGGEVVWNNVD